MLVGRVVWHEVQYHLEPSCMSLRQQALEVSRGSEDRVNASIVADGGSCTRAQGDTGLRAKPHVRPTSLVPREPFVPRQSLA